LSFNPKNFKGCCPIHPIPKPPQQRCLCPPGPRGAIGPAGPTGATGAQGATGATGAQGPPGRGFIYRYEQFLDPVNGSDITGDGGITNPFQFRSIPE
jgi:hypothetical protein